MPGYSKTPVILLVFANDRVGDASSYLRKLMHEKREVSKALEPAVNGRHCQVISEHSLTHKGFYDLLDTYGARIVGVHFGGHADPRGLQFEDHYGESVPAHMDGIAQRLAGLKQLRWVFLNGCGTAVHVDVLQRQVPVPVIATETAIRDDIAANFARRFYFSLARGQSIGDAFTAAEGEVRTHTGDAAAVVRGPHGGAFFAGAAEPLPGEAADSEAPYRMLRPSAVAPTEWPWILALPTTSKELKPPQDWRLVAMQPPVVISPPGERPSKIHSQGPVIRPPGRSEEFDIRPALVRPPWYKRPAVLGVAALALLVIAGVVLSRVGGDRERGGQTVARDAGPHPTSGPLDRGTVPPDAAVDAAAVDAAQPEAAQPDAAQPDAAPPTVDAAPPVVDAARPVVELTRRSAYNAAARRRSSVASLERKARQRAGRCDCAGLQAAVASLSDYGVDRSALYQKHCARGARLGTCGQAIDGQISSALASCPCDSPSTKSKIDRLKRDFGKDRSREYELRCVVPGLPQSCRQ